MQERPPASACTPDLPPSQQLTDRDTAPRGVSVERADRRKFAVHSRFRAMMSHRRQHRDPSIASLQRQPQPGDELTHIIEPHQPPVQPTIGEKDEPVLQIVRIRLDRVRSAFDIGQIRQIPLNRFNRRVVSAENGPRLMRRDR